MSWFRPPTEWAAGRSPVRDVYKRQQVVLLRISDILPLNPLETGLMWEWEPVPSDRQTMDELRQAAEAYLREAAARHGLASDEAQTLVLDGAPADRIQEYARLSAIDLIAMSTHGRTGLRRWLYGSVTAKVRCV